jgi:RNA polymerase sigma-70 factor (ECF subfamily)
LGRLLARHLPSLQRWARGRLPRWARDIADTADLVQETVLQTIRRIGSFDPRHRNALQSYLRQAVLNRIRNEYRRSGRHPAPEKLGELQADHRESPLEGTIRTEREVLFQQALARLRLPDREVIVGRFELNYSYEQLALMLDKSSPDAARVALRRAIVKLAEEMEHAQV